MENKNEFDDIILEKSNKNEKIKKILLRVIALVILFLVVMIVMKLINSSDTPNENIVPEEPSVEITSNNGDSVVIENDPAEMEFEMIKNTLQGNNQENNDTIVEENITQNDVFLVPENNKTPELVVEQEQIVEEPVANVEKKPSQVKTESKKETSKKQEIKQNTKPVKKAEVQDSTSDLFKDIGNNANSSTLTPGIYVQIFSVSNLDQKSRELAEVKKKGYNYKLYKTSVNGKEIHKVLIGPFKKDTVKSELEKIRANVAKDAFTFVVK